MSEPTPTVSDHWVETELWNHGRGRYATTTGQWLEIHHGKVPLRFRFDLDHGGDPQRLAQGCWNLACLHRVADSTGQVWQARTCFRPSLFVYRLIGLNHLEQPLWQHNAEEWCQAIQERPLVTGLYEVMDDRYYRRFWVDDVLLEIQFKYQGLTIDIGQLDKDRLAIRLSGWFGTWNHVPMDEEGGVPIYQGEPIRPPEAKYDQRDDPLREYSEDIDEFAPGGWLENLSPIVYTMWNWDVLFRSDADWENDYPVQVPFPRPILWEPIEGYRAEAVECVRIVTIT